jgi:hypothetical protein
LFKNIKKMRIESDVLDFEDIKKMYPDEWVLIANPEMREPTIQASIVSQLVRGIVLTHSKDKREIANQSRSLKQGFKSYTCVFTGEIPKTRSFSGLISKEAALNLHRQLRKMRKEWDRF